jgi:hypothetical protein
MVNENDPIELLELKELLKVETNELVNNLFYADTISKKITNKIGITSGGVYLFNISFGDLEKKYNGKYLVFSFMKSDKSAVRLYEYGKNKYRLISNMDIEKKLDIVKEFNGEKNEVYIKAIEFLIESSNCA